MKFLFLNAMLIDGGGTEPISMGGMLVEGSRIAAVGRANEFSRSGNDTEIIDCSGKTIMPGLINGHVHVFMEPYTWDRLAYRQKPLCSLRSDIIKNLEKTVRSGVTYVRDLGGVFDFDIQFRELIKKGEVSGPSMLCARHPLTVTGGHGADFSNCCDGVPGFVRGVRAQIAAGADIIKIMPTAGYARAKMQVNHSIIEDTTCMSPEEIRATANEAHSLGKKVAAHCCGFAGVYNSVMNGVDTIEHGQFREPRKDEAKRLAEAMAERGTWLVPTLSAFFKEYKRSKVEEKYLPVIESFQLCHERGVKIAMGTDAGVPWVGHDKAAAELEHMTLYGMSNMEAIMASTSSAAKMLGIFNEYGTLESGKFADFLILDEDPLKDIKVLQKNMQVWRHGALV